jgi:steroid delta-isomerase
MRAVMQRYLERVARQDVDGVLELFADTISVEDPVGGPPGSHVVGRDAVERFFRLGFASARPSPRLTGPIRATDGNEAAMPFTLGLDLRGVRHEIDVIDVMSFAPDGRIASLRAFWNPRDARRYSPEASGSPAGSRAR